MRGNGRERERERGREERGEWERGIPLVDGGASHKAEGVDGIVVGGRPVLVVAVLACIQSIRERER